MLSALHRLSQTLAWHTNKALPPPAHATATVPRQDASPEPSRPRRAREAERAAEKATGEEDSGVPMQAPQVTQNIYFWQPNALSGHSHCRSWSSYRASSWSWALRHRNPWLPAEPRAGRGFQSEKGGIGGVVSSPGDAGDDCGARAATPRRRRALPARLAEAARRAACGPPRTGLCVWMLLRGILPLVCLPCYAGLDGDSFPTRLALLAILVGLLELSHCLFV